MFAILPPGPKEERKCHQQDCWSTFFSHLGCVSGQGWGASCESNLSTLSAHARAQLRAASCVVKLGQSCVRHLSWHSTKLLPRPLTLCPPLQRGPVRLTLSTAVKHTFPAVSYHTQKGTAVTESLEWNSVFVVSFDAHSYFLIMTCHVVIRAVAMLTLLFTSASCCQGGR